MAKLALKKAATDVTVYLFAQDSSKTTGAGLTGLAYNTSGLTAYYVRPLGSATQITLATQTVTGSHSDGGFVEVSSTNMPGVYRLDLPDAVCATGVPSAVVMLKGATNLAPVLLEIQLTDFDLNTAAVTAAAVADAVWDEATSGHTSAGSFSKAVTDILADTGTDGVVVASGQTVATVTNLTNLPAMPTDWVTAAGVKADAVTKIQNGLATPTNITSASGVELKSTQGKITWDQQKIVADVAYECALLIQNTNDNGIGQGIIGVYAGQVNSGGFGQVNESVQDNGVAQYNMAAGIDGIAQKNEATQPSGINVSGHDPALALEATLEEIKGAGWTNETLVALKNYVDELETRLTAARAGYLDKLNVPGTLANSNDANTYKADVSGLATTLHVQEVENKVDLIDVTTVANSGKIDAVDAKVSAIDTDTIMSFMIDGFTFEQIIQIMASVLAGKLTRSGDTLTFRDLADTVNRVIAETDANKQRTDMTYTV